MQLEFFHHKINELWEELKKDGVNTKVASFVIAHHFTNQDRCVMEVIENVLDNKLDEIMKALEWFYPSFIDINQRREEMKFKLFPQWRNIHNLKKIRKEFDYLKDMENVKKFIETLEELRAQNSRSNGKPKTNNAIDAIDDNFYPHR